MKRQTKGALPLSGLEKKTKLVNSCYSQTLLLLADYWHFYAFTKTFHISAIEKVRESSVLFDQDFNTSLKGSCLLFLNSVCFAL